MKKLIKVCGMRETQNIKELIELDIDMMGMIFYKKSPRFISEVPQVKFPDRVDKVGVFVNSSFEEILEIIKDFGLKKIQLHGNESVELCEKISGLGIEVIKAFGIDESFNFSEITKYEDVCSLFVFDTKTKAYGGSGKKFNWKKLNEYNGEVPFLLSGGITSNDINEVIEFDHPKYLGVDLNSGFELEPAIKDIKLLNEFVDKYRSNN